MTEAPNLKIAICMATYNPERHAFARQVESIRGQTLGEWHCWIFDDGSTSGARHAIREVVGDDPRFSQIYFPENVGFYRNFERALARVQGQARWVALADQDDIWAPDKLEILVRVALANPPPHLVYADMEVRTSDGGLVSPTYWVGRARNERDLAALLFANTVTGAASLFSDELLATALPFPKQYPTSFHDHWLALIARSAGHITYVDRAVQIYVQHSSNAIGHQPGQRSPKLMRRLMSTAWWRRPVDRYFDDEVARLSDLARTLLARTNVEGADAGVLRAVASLHGDRPQLLWMAQETLREVRDPSLTMWRRRRVFASVLWTQVARFKAAVPRGKSSW